AAAVKNSLAARGVAPARMTTVGFGESKPIADNATEAGRSLNRRVEITIVPQQQ
ncbi:OmpA family protein, partial [bacterium]|nr:OmpA family protein [bacterium]